MEKHLGSNNIQLSEWGNVNGNGYFNCGGNVFSICWNVDALLQHSIQGEGKANI